MSCPPFHKWWPRERWFYGPGMLFRRIHPAWSQHSYFVRFADLKCVGAPDVNLINKRTLKPAGYGVWARKETTNAN